MTPAEPTEAQRQRAREIADAVADEMQRALDQSADTGAEVEHVAVEIIASALASEAAGMREECAKALRIALGAFGQILELEGAEGITDAKAIEDAFNIASHASIRIEDYIRSLSALPAADGKEEG